MIPLQFGIGTLSRLALVLAIARVSAGQDLQIDSAGVFAGWATNGPGVFQRFVVSTQVLPGPPVAFLPPPVELPPEIRGAMVMFRNVANVTVYTNTRSMFDHYVPESLNNLVWTNFIAHTNGRNMVIWSERRNPIGWPARPPVVRWNTDSLMWGMKGLTALSPSWELEGNPGQVPITALTRRHGYTRGHSMGPDGIGTACAGRRVWFLSAQNTIVETKVLREVVRTVETSGRDYTILLFSSDLPESIQPMRVIATQDVFGSSPTKYQLILGVPCPLFKTEQTGGVSAEVPGFTCDTYKGGDSGSPNMLPMPGELVFWTGRSTSGASPEMQADMDKLCRLEGLDPRKYQLQWLDLSAYHNY